MQSWRFCGSNKTGMNYFKNRLLAKGSGLRWKCLLMFRKTTVESVSRRRQGWCNLAALNSSWVLICSELINEFWSRFLKRQDPVAPQRSLSTKSKPNAIWSPSNKHSVTFRGTENLLDYEYIALLIQIRVHNRGFVQLRLLQRNKVSKRSNCNFALLDSIKLVLYQSKQRVKFRPVDEFLWHRTEIMTHSTKNWHISPKFPFCDRLLFCRMMVSIFSTP